jgi:hypothetical protein
MSAKEDIQDITLMQHQQTASSCMQDFDTKEQIQKEYNRIRQKRYRERVKAAKEAQQAKKERKRI